MSRSRNNRGRNRGTPDQFPRPRFLGQAELVIRCVSTDRELPICVGQNGESWILPDPESRSVVFT